MKKNRIREPYSPENTPNPPQVIDPNLQKERESNNVLGDDKRTDNGKKSTSLAATEKDMHK